MDKFYVRGKTRKDGSQKKKQRKEELIKKQRESKEK
jgi:hypothetical protein